MKHSHYHKAVGHLQTVDIYRVLQMFDVTDPCLQHAAKKILCAGQRGTKTQAQDVQEAIDTLARYQSMQAEDMAQPAAPTPARAEELQADAQARPTKTGRDLYTEKARGWPDARPWCDLPDEDQADWNAVAKNQS